MFGFWVRDLKFWLCVWTWLDNFDISSTYLLTWPRHKSAAISKKFYPFNQKLFAVMGTGVNCRKTCSSSAEHHACLQHGRKVIWLGCLPTSISEMDNGRWSVRLASSMTSVIKYQFRLHFLLNQVMFDLKNKCRWIS